MFSKWFSKTPVVPTSEELAQLKTLCLEVSRGLQKAGYQTPPFSIDARPCPANFSYRLHLLQVFSELLAEHQEDPGKPTHKDLLWKFLSRMRLTPTSDLLDRIGDEDCVEIYDAANEQIFRNLNYFSIVSFSVEDMVSIDWRRDYKRLQNVTVHLLELVFRFATGHFYSTYDCSKVPIHNVQEMIAKRYLIELQLKWVSPLRQNGKFAGIVAVSRARRLSATT